MEQVKNVRSKLGVDVEITNEQLPQDPALSESLLRLGKMNAPQGMEVKVAFCTFFYAPKSDSLLMKNQMNFMHANTDLQNVSEKVISLAVSDLARHLMNVFGRRKPATRDALDKRKDFI